MPIPDVVAGLAWDPQMRGFMAVLVAVVVLVGSVRLLLSTNSGPRLGTLLALAGLFGWMTILATVWWIYGIGYKGFSPSWRPVEIVASADRGDLTLAAHDRANTLHSEELPRAYDLVVASDDPVALVDFGPVSRESLPPAELLGRTDAEIQALVDETQALHEATTLSELDAVAPELIDESLPAFGGWNLLSSAESGEAQASAGAMLTVSSDFGFTDTTQFEVLEAHTVGGKSPLPPNPTRWDRIYTQTRSALTITITITIRYGIVQVQRVTPGSLVTIPGEAPPRAMADTGQPVISVVMIRDLGNPRVLPALVAVGSGLIFAALVYMLHERDKEAMRRRAEFRTETA